MGPGEEAEPSRFGPGQGWAPGEMDLSLPLNFLFLLDLPPPGLGSSIFLGCLGSALFRSLGSIVLRSLSSLPP